MSFLDHIEELRWHLFRSAIAVMLMAVVVFFKVEWIFHHIILGPASPDFIAYKWFCQLGQALHVDGLCLPPFKLRFQNTELAGQFVMSLSVSLMLGFVLAFPYVLWELWKFIRPALKTIEIKYARGIVTWCSALFFIGVLFAYYIIGPYTINFFAGYQLDPSFENIITVNNYYDTLSDLIIGMGVVFELPVIVYFLSRIGILTPKMMRTQRRYAVLILLILAEVITPPDMFSCLIVFIPLYLLYELSIVISERTVKERKKRLALQELDN